MTYSVLFIKVQKKEIFDASSFKTDIKESNFLGSAESISQLVSNSIERKRQKINH